MTDMPMNSQELEAQIAEAEKAAASLEVEAGQRKEWLQATEDYVTDFLERLPDDRMYQPAGAEGEKEAWKRIPEEGIPLPEALDLYRRYAEAPGLHVVSGNMFGYIPGSNLLPGAIADFISAVSNRYTGVYFASPGSVRMEHALIRWMCELVGYPATALGNLTSGGSIASLIAIATARDVMKMPAADVPRAVIYLSGQTHHSIEKALRIAGLREAVVRQIAVDTGYRMDAGALGRQVEQDLADGLKPFMVVSNAGTTDTGAVDPMDAIADVAEAHGLWHHADAAYGGFFLLTDEARHRFKGIERTDSVTIDPHKGLFIPFGSGALLIKDVKGLADTHHYFGNYMQDAMSLAEELSPADLGPELTRHFRGLRMWLPLKVYGLAPFRAALREKLLLCRYFYEKVTEWGFERGPEPELSVALYRYVPSRGEANAFNAALVEEIRKDGRVFISSTTIDGVYWLRAAILNFRTHKVHVDRLLDVLGEKVAKLQAVSAEE